MDVPLHHIIKKLKKPQICVCGDFMLDTYVRGQVGRVSPEGPIPVLHVDQKHHLPGGAGSVASMLRALGAGVHCVGVRGDDMAGLELDDMLRTGGCKVEGLFVDASRPTTLKTRYMGYVQSAGRGVQQMLRVDEEHTDPIPPETAERTFQYIAGLAGDVDLVLLQDMAKGMLSPDLIRRIISLCSHICKPVIVDPSIKQNYDVYTNATCMVPNRMETGQALGMALEKETDYETAAVKLVERLKLQFAVITLDCEGMFYASADGKRAHIHTTPRSVLDVTGAGDMTAATLSLALAGGLNVEEAVRLANAAAGIEVSRQGAAPVSIDELEEELRLQSEPSINKIKHEADVPSVIQNIRSRGESIAFTNGVFDILHLGHVELIRFAAAQADRLIIGLNSDSSVRAFKGKNRPIIPQHVRARTLAAMPAVDYVVIFEDPSVQSLIEKVSPDVLVKGGDYASNKDVVGWEVVEKKGGKVLRAPHVEGFSTTDIITRIRRTSDEKRD